MTSVNAFEHDGVNGFASCGFNARNGTPVLPTTRDLYLTTYDGLVMRLVKINSGQVLWSVQLPGSTAKPFPDLTINANGIYTLVGHDGTNDNLCRWSRGGTLLNSATLAISDGTICSNTLGSVFAAPVGFAPIRKYDADLTLDVTGTNVDNVPSFGSHPTRLSACAPLDGDPFFTRRFQGGGGGFARGYQESNAGLYSAPETHDHAIGVFVSGNAFDTFGGSAPAFNQAGNPGFCVAWESNGQRYVGHGYDQLATGIILSDNVGNPFSPYSQQTPVHVSTNADSDSFFPNGTKLERYTDLNSGPTIATPLWSLEAEAIFTSLPTGASIDNVPCAILPVDGEDRAYVWGFTHDSTAGTYDRFVGQMTLSTQAEVWLIRNTDPLVNGLLGPLPGGPFITEPQAIVAGVIDQPGEGYSNPDVF